MKRNIKIASITFILLMLLGISYFIFFHNALWIDSSVKNTGRILPSKNDGTIRFTEEFKLSNYGFTTIKLDMITASCGCTKILCPPKIEPFSSAKLLADVEYPASILEGKSVDIVIESSAKDSPKMLKLISEAGNYYSYSPASINWGGFYKSGKRSSEIFIQVSTPEDQNAHIDIARIPQNLTYKIRKTDERFVKFTDGSVSRFSTFYIVVALNDRHNVGKFTESLDILIRGERDYNISIPVLWEILPDASFTLDSYYFSKNQNAVAIILNYDASIKKIKDISLSNKNFKIISKKDFNNGLELLVKYDGALRNEANSVLSVSFEDGKDPVSAVLNYILKY